MIKEQNMKSKQILVSLLAIVSLLYIVATVSATEIANIEYVEVNDLPVGYEISSVLAGDTITVEVYFEAREDASDVRIKAEIQGDKIDVDEKTGQFDVEEGILYKKILVLEVPYELRNEVSNDLELSVKIWNGDYETEESFVLRVQRPSYNVEVKSVAVSSTITAGEIVPVDVVLKNRGYNDLEDLEVRVSIPALGVQRTAYFGDLVAVECSEKDADDGLCKDADDEDTVSGRVYLTVPYNAVAGLYSLEIEVENYDTTSTKVKQILVENDFAGNTVAPITGKTVAVKADAEYDLLLVNPTNNIKVYNLIPESSDGLAVKVSESVVAVSAGSSRTVKVTARASEEGTYNFKVNVFSGSELVNQVDYSLAAQGNAIANPIVVLTVILVIIFVVLLVVLAILLGKKPVTEELGESYY